MDRRVSLYAILFAVLLIIITIFSIMVTDTQKKVYQNAQEKKQEASDEVTIVADEPEVTTAVDEAEATKNIATEEPQIDATQVKDANDLNMLKSYLGSVKSSGEVGSFETNMVALKVGETRKITITDSQRGNYWLINNSDVVMTKWIDNSVSFTITAVKEGMCKVGVSTESVGGDEINLVVWCY